MVLVPGAHPSRPEVAAAWHWSPESEVLIETLPARAKRRGRRARRSVPGAAASRLDSIFLPYSCTDLPILAPDALSPDWKPLRCRHCRREHEQLPGPRTLRLGRTGRVVGERIQKLGDKQAQHGLGHSLKHKVPGISWVQNRKFSEKTRKFHQNRLKEPRILRPHALHFWCRFDLVNLHNEPQM